MKRFFHITPRSDSHISGFDLVHPENVEDIVNYSVDHIYIDCLELLPLSDAKNLLVSIANKIRLEGLLTIVLSNTKQISRNYSSNMLTDEEYLKLNNNHKCVISLSSIAEIIQSLDSVKIVKLEHSTDQLEFAITTQRVSI